MKLSFALFTVLFAASCTHMEGSHQEGHQDDHHADVHAKVEACIKSGKSSEDCHKEVGAACTEEEQKENHKK